MMTKEELMILNSCIEVLNGHKTSCESVSIHGTFFAFL